MHSSLLSQRISAAILALQAGRPVIVTDDNDREDEADLILAADAISIPEMARMIRDGSGIVCLCLTEEKARALQLAPMVSNNESQYGTAFTVTIEAKEGITTGVSAADRTQTIRTAVATNAQASDLARPGHVFPLIANAGGVLARRGHTEASIELATLAGFSPAGVLCELMNPDGTMMRGEQLHRYSEDNQLPMLSIADLVEWKQQTNATQAIALTH
ncbi:3,4-dihydroxy-2-butanone-4-phosphate synthase [Leeia sp. TBRC 13508]|uniref:3,4-dihydroxy-2-butanone 4-phosphate synthase n=1 Tax=Leeia speluncae TaxID=2884804 RepID=A0ABS8D3P3_9NEIS|nr:3,4-dihydroxy-2-butanone-4-phosphate synthase [Leeia speluncae]MCB6182821.1 3,4-dihydroxy-2-butanone-4-phosphate synthase [Leeia speluncae]